MLVIRMQRTGRKGHAMFRLVVQDSRRTPTSGKLVASLGSYDPHTKTINLDKEKAQFYLDHGAQPSDRMARLLKSEGVKLPKWVEVSANKERTVRNAEKRRSTAPEKPAEEAAPAAEETAESAEAETPAEENPIETPQADTPAVEEAPAAEAPEDAPVEASEEPAEEKPNEADSDPEAAETTE